MSNRNNSYERNIRKYEMFINDKHYINKLINEVRNGRKNSNKAIVEAYNRANVDYRKKSMEYYISKAKAHGGETFKLLSDAEIRAKIQNLLKNYPSRPPCPTKGGKGNRRKTAEAVAQMCGAYCTRQVSKVCGAVGRSVKSVIPGVKRARTNNNNNNTNTNNNNNRNRINIIRTRVKEGVLKNKVNQNTISIINGMTETQLRRLAREKGISIPRNLSKPK
jgi:hypothetical protein